MPLRNHQLCWAAILVLWCCASAAAQFRGLGLEQEALVEPKFELLDNASRAHLDRVDQLLADGQQDEAVEILRRVMETDGDKLLRVAEYKDDRPTPYVRHYPVRLAVQMKLAGLAAKSPEGLALYRTRVDRIAERWFKQAIEQKDHALLERVARDFFASSYGDDALWQLGERALARGDHAAAREAWERLSPHTRTPTPVAAEWPAPPGRPLWLALRGAARDEQWAKIGEALAKPPGELNWLAYPDTDISLADIRARLALVSILEGNRERAAVELELVKRLHPEATGRIGGREGRYVDLLTSLQEQSAGWSAPRDASGWPTFAGSPARNRVLNTPLSPAEKELWHVDLPAITSDRDAIGSGRPRVAEEHRGLFSYHPVVWNDIVLVPEHTQIRALKLADGLSAWPGAADGVIYRFASDAAEEEESEHPIKEPHPRSRPYVGVARFTATVSGDKLFARMGSRITISAEPNPADREKQGVIVGIDLAAQGRMLRGFPLRAESAEWNFEGTPVTDGVGLYVALRKHDQVNTQSHVACYDVATGELRWRRWICTAGTPGHGTRDELSHGLLSLADGELYVNTNLGAIAKLSAASGAVRWTTQYPRGMFPNTDPDRRDRHFFRDLTPCVAYQGMAICAPSDCEAIFALDASTGQLIWTTPPEVASDAIHLLGVGGNKLIASGDYLYWFDVYTGHAAGQYPPPQKDAPGFGLPSTTGFGRGVLAAGKVYWPTRERILVFEQSIPRTERGYDPAPASEIKLFAPREARSGNLIPVGDKLLIVGAKKLQVFGSEK